jgi:hypothetical protein
MKMIGINTDLLSFTTLIQAVLPPPTWAVDRILALAANAALVIALGINAWQLNLMRKQLQDTKYATKMSRSLEFCHRCNDLSFALYRKNVYDLLETDPKLNDFLNRIDQDSDFKASLRFVLNFYEEIGMAYNKGEVDQTIIREFYSGQIEFLYKHTSPYIQHMRTTYGEGLWIQFTTMRESVRAV